ncbi:MAG: deoxyribonuclease IV [Planctomycetota bacterium]
MILGSHVSCQGGFAKAVGRATEIDCDCIQIFVSNPPRQWPVFAPKNSEQEKAAILVTTDFDRINSWYAKPLDTKKVSDWHEAIDSSKLSHPIAHASYLINLASPKQDLFEKSVDALVVEWNRCNELGLQGLVMHPGSFTESSEEEGLDRIIDGVAEVLGRVDKGTCRLLLENTAGQGSCLGYTFEQLAFLIDGIDDLKRIGVCLDTCHAFAAGYDLRDSDGFSDFRQQIDDLLPPDTIAALHLNDSKKPLGSRVDRHEHIGEGEIGLDAFRFVLEDDLLGKLPGYLETEKGTDEESGEDWDVINLNVLRGLLR